MAFASSRDDRLQATPKGDEIMFESMAFHQLSDTFFGRGQ